MINAIHIEDEPRNVELLANLLHQYCADTIRLCGNAGNKKDALALIEKTNPQLVYLDIELTNGNAFELLEELNEKGLFNFQVVFITAFNEYAVKAFRYNAVDYLLKPISINELKEASNKVISKILLHAGNGAALNAIKQVKLNLNNHKIGLPDADGIVFISINDIIKVEARAGYSVLYLTQNKKITSTKNLKDIEEMLPESSFLRVHHSWIINIQYLRKYYRGKNSYVELDDNSKVMVSSRKKNRFLNFM
jgi:two-component system LytT family response regulator